MTNDRIGLDLTDEQAEAVERAVTVGEALSCGRWSVVADLVRDGLIVGPEGVVAPDPKDVEDALSTSVELYRSAAGEPIFGDVPLGYDARDRSVSTERVPVFCEALDRFVRLGLGQFKVLDELGREEVFSARGGRRDELSLTRAADCVEFVRHLVGHRPRASHSIGSRELDPIFKRAYEVMKVVRKHQSELSGDHGMLSSVHGDGLVVRYTQDPQPAVVQPPSPASSF